MKNQKYLMLSILFCAVAGFSLAPAYANDLGATTYNTGTQYFWSTGNGYLKLDGERIDSTHLVHGQYAPKHNKPEYYANTVDIEILGHTEEPPIKEVKPNYKMTKCVVEFRKKVNGQVQKSTKTFQPGTEGFTVVNGIERILYKPKNDYVPYSAVVYYQKR